MANSPSVTAHSPFDMELTAAMGRFEEEVRAVQWYTSPLFGGVTAHRTQFERLPQSRYRGQSLFYSAQPSVSFLDEASNPTPLHILQDRGFRRQDWEYPWTQANHQDVGQTMTLRVRLVDCSIDKQINVRRSTSTSEAYTKSRLGHEIAKGLGEPLKEALQLQNIPFKSIVLYQLDHVSMGSWQPVLGVKRTPAE